MNIDHISKFVRNKQLLSKWLMLTKITMAKNKKMSAQQKLECLKKVIANSKEHIKANDSKRIYSQYMRYAMDEFSDVNFCTSQNAKGLARKDVIHEHVVPHGIVMDKLLKIEPLTTENILSVIKKYYVICAITKDEDKLLNQAKLRSKMPKGWNEEVDSIFARYQAVRIEILK